MDNRGKKESRFLKLLNCFCNAPFPVPEFVSATVSRDVCQITDVRTTTSTIFLPPQKSTRFWGMLFFHLHLLETEKNYGFWHRQNVPCLIVEDPLKSFWVVSLSSERSFLLKCLLIRRLSRLRKLFLIVWRNGAMGSIKLTHFLKLRFESM